MAFPPNFLEELRARVPLASVVARRVKLVKKGREFHGLCPFHNEKTPSFTVNEDKGFFHCFGCGAHGDAIGFEMRAGHLSFTEAVEKLAAEAGIEVPKSTPEERVREARRAGLHDVLDAACRFYEQQLRAPAGRQGLAYLKERGLSDDTIARFRLGWAPDGREALKKAVMSDTCPETLLIEAGLLKKPDGGGPSFDYFRGRVMFPITDRRGRVVAFGARTLGDGQPKYLNSPETPLFHKGATLYGLAHARDMARERNMVVVAEGYMDVIALHQAGFAFAVAPLGTAVTEQQIEELWRLAPEPVLCLDGDAAGQRAMARAAERAMPILKPGLSLRFASLPAPEDPDSLIKSRGAGAMQAVLDTARPLVEVVWSLAVEGRPLDTPERCAALEKEMKDKAFAIADETVRWQYLGAFRERLRDLLRPRRPAYGGGGTGKRFEPKRRPGDPPLRAADGRLPGVGRPAPPLDPRIKQERALLALAVENPLLLEWVGETLGEMRFSDSGLDNLRRGILKHLSVARDIDSGRLKAYLRSDGLSSELDGLLGDDDRRGLAVRRFDLIDEARTRWEHIFHQYSKRELQADVRQAMTQLAEDPSQASFARLAALKAHQQALDGDDTEAGSGEDGGRRG